MSSPGLSRKKLKENVTVHGYIARGHDRDKPDNTHCQGIIPPGHPDVEKDKSAVSVGQGGAEPWVKPELSCNSKDVLVQ